jgi:phenylacetate-coenzyme A ligase PaaK-like adenylate-forming protein
MLAFDTNKIFTASPHNFETIALEVFRFQYHNNALYQSFVNQLGVQVANVTQVTHIPFLPIQFFKNKSIATTTFEPQQIFTSSGTTGSITSSHLVKDITIYEQAFRNGFKQFYGDVTNYCILGLLPSYLERNGSSLVYMVNDLIQHSQHELSDFYLDELDHLYLLLQQMELDKQPTLLIGVTFALLDFATRYKMNLEHTIIMETGGMKGRGKELTRSEVHQLLQQQLGVKAIHSEYGMTELLSQAYSKGNGIFECTNTMQVYVRSMDNPLQVSHTGKGVLNVIDLANVYSCSFIATDDLAQIESNNTFTIQGRLDNSDLRGCSLLTV